MVRCIGTAMEDWRVHLAGELNQARQEIALLREELRIKDIRMARIL